jgi:hypothetical protein
MVTHHRLNMLQDPDLVPVSVIQKKIDRIIITDACRSNALDILKWILNLIIDRRLGSNWTIDRFWECVTRTVSSGLKILDWISQSGQVHRFTVDHYMFTLAHEMFPISLWYRQHGIGLEITSSNAHGHFGSLMSSSIHNWLKEQENNDIVKKTTQEKLN